MPVALAQIKDLLLPGLWGISGKYPMIEREWPKVFRQTDSNMALERLASMRYLPLAAIKQEGAPTSFDNNSGERYIYNQEHDEIGLGFAITRKALVNDDLDAFARIPQKFGRMAKNLESDLVWYQILKNANMADGNALFSAAHRNYEDRNVSAKARAEIDSVEQASSTHLGEIPRTPIRKRGRPAKTQVD